MDIEHYKRRLLALERELVTRLTKEVGTARDARDDQAASGDLAHTDELREEYFTVADLDTATLEEVRAALLRIEDGTFGRCVADGEPIDEKRLAAIPWTPYCLKHQLERDRAVPLSL